MIFRDLMIGPVSDDHLAEQQAFLQLLGIDQNPETAVYWIRIVER
jgi:hypothetical protein